jgi:hypothetical protein
MRLQVLARPRSVSLDTLTAAAAIYNSLYALPPDEGGGVCATFQVVSLSGWVSLSKISVVSAHNFLVQVPDASQPKAKTRGSAGVSLKDLVEL